VELVEQELEGVDGLNIGHQGEVVAAENADEGAANQLPSRPFSGHTSETAQVPTIDVTGSAEGSQRSTA
jgi:hypothetical protein